MKHEEDLELLSRQQWKALIGVGLASRGYRDVNPRRISAKDVSRCTNNSVGNLGDTLSNLAVKKDMLVTHNEFDVSTGRLKVLYKLSPKGRDYLINRINHEQATV
jgi:hypothetical protein